MRQDKELGRDNAIVWGYRTKRFGGKRTVFMSDCDVERAGCVIVAYSELESVW